MQKTHGFEDTQERIERMRLREVEAERLAEIERSLDAVVDTLSVMERRFTIGLLFHGKVGKAAKEAGYKYPDKQGSRLAKRPRIVAAIEAYFRQQEMPAIEVIARLSQQAQAAYAPFLKADGTVDLEGLLAARLGHLIKGFKQTKYGLQVEFCDAYQALVQVGRYHGLFTDRTDVVSDGEPIRMIEVVVPGDRTEDAP